MIKIILCFFILTFSFFSKSFESIETLNSIVIEKTHINGQWREKKYYISLVYPDKVYKETLEPKLNLGEKTIYLGNYKWVYYPIFDEVYKEKLDGEENYILSALKSVKNETGKRTYKDSKIYSLWLSDGIKLIFEAYSLINSVYFPQKIQVYDGKNLISLIEFKDTEINENYNKHIFDVKGL